jgi:diaminohydroxyphosphoribosylaminopyrimidine deaminase/5-amino-6-(5-phosphoribosylamino)uracil reductase
MSAENPHEYWMARALQQARKGFYSTHPNPRVGCVIVSQGEQVAAGFHAFPGGPHAEINALAELDAKAQECTVYVTLEPCSHSGKTPPCADALIQAGVHKVVIAMQDPNPLVAGKGIEKLRQAGIEVITGVLNSQAIELNPGFNKRMTTAYPFVRVKMASSLDGRTALANGLSQWISGEEARQDVQFLRASSSAVLSTAETVIRDDASLNVRLDSAQLKQEQPVRQPVRVILDRQLRLTGRERLFSIEGEIWLFTCENDELALAEFDQDNVTLFTMCENEEGQFDLKAVLRKLAALGINEIHTECGAKLAGALLQHKLVDELVIYMAPSLLGDQAAGMFDLGEISIMSDRLQLSVQDVRAIGQDIKITAKPE